MQRLIKLHQFILNILSSNKIRRIIECHNYCYFVKIDNTNLDLVKVNAYAKFAQIPSIPSQNIEGR